MGIVAIKLLDMDGALHHFRESVRINGELGDYAAMVDPVQSLAIVACKTGDYSRAAELFGMVDWLEEAMTAPADESMQAEAMECIALIREKMPRSEFEIAWSIARHVSRDQMLTDLLT